MGVVYKITSKTTGKSYVGATTRSLRLRMYTHVNDMHRGRTAPLYVAMRKYGVDDFAWKILYESTDSSSLQKMEKFFVQKLHTLKPNGYNATLGGDTNFELQARNRGKPVRCITTNKVYGSLKDASISTGQSEKYISYMCNGKPMLKSRYTAYPKFEWASHDEITEDPTHD